MVVFSGFDAGPGRHGYRKIGPLVFRDGHLGRGDGKVKSRAFGYQAYFRDSPVHVILEEYFESSLVFDCEVVYFRLDD